MGSHSRSDDRSSHSKHARSSSRRDDDSSSRSHKRHRSSRDDDDGSRRDRKHSSRSEGKRTRSRSRSRDRHRSSRDKRDRRDVDAADNNNDDDEWEEKAPEGAAAPPAQGQRPPVDSVGTFEIGSMPTAQALRRLEQENLTDGYGEGDVGGSSSRGGGLFGLPQTGQDDADLFGSLGTERKRREPKEKVDPTNMMGQSSRELNKAYWQGTPNPASTSSAAAAASSSAAPASGSPAPGSTGSAWRMTKLKRTYEAAEEEGRPVEEVALERYGSLADFEEAKEERRVLDERSGRRQSRRESGYGAATDARTPTGMAADGGGRRFVFTETGTEGASASGSRPSSRQGFRRPGEAPPSIARSSSASSIVNAAAAGGSTSRPSTPIPSVFTPPVARRAPSQLAQSATLVDPDPTSTGAAVSAVASASSASASARPVLTQSELNKLQARVLKARLMDSDEAGALEQEYERERRRAEEAGPAVRDHEGMEQTLGGSRTQGQDVQVLPTMDGRGRLYDVGVGTEVADKHEEERKAKGRRGKKEPNFQSHDPKTGEVLRNQADDDALSLGDLVRQERFGGGATDQRALDSEFANRIATDARFSTDLDYIDENAEKLARKKMKSEAMKRQFAINDYARTKKALDSCTLCYSDEGDPPKAPVVALGTRTYLALMENEELVPGHCRIVPVQHYLSCLEIDEEEGWDEIKNFMKTLMQMFANDDKGVVFFETITSHKGQRHSYIEAIPVPFDLFDQLPIYFSEAISTSESEWAQHKKLITFTPARPFRRSLVPNLPYFAVQFDYKGEKGFGHIIEGVDDAPDRDLDGEEIRGEFGEKGGGEFPRYFAQEIIGNLLSLEPRKWRKPRRLDRRDQAQRVADFRKRYDRFDWTKMLAGGGGSATAGGSGRRLHTPPEVCLCMPKRSHGVDTAPSSSLRCSRSFPAPPLPLSPDSSLHRRLSALSSMQQSSLRAARPSEPDRARTGEASEVGRNWANEDGAGGGAHGGGSWWTREDLEQSRAHSAGAARDAGAAGATSGGQPAGALAGAVTSMPFTFSSPAGTSVSLAGLAQPSSAGLHLAPGRYSYADAYAVPPSAYLSPAFHPFSPPLASPVPVAATTPTSPSPHHLGFYMNGSEYAASDPAAGPTAGARPTPPSSAFVPPAGVVHPVVLSWAGGSEPGTVRVQNEATTLRLSQAEKDKIRGEALLRKRPSQAVEIKRPPPRPGANAHTSATPTVAAGDAGALASSATASSADPPASLAHASAPSISSPTFTFSAAVADFTPRSSATTSVPPSQSEPSEHVSPPTTPLDCSSGSTCIVAAAESASSVARPSEVASTRLRPLVPYGLSDSESSSVEGSDDEHLSGTQGLPAAAHERSTSPPSEGPVSQDEDDNAASDNKHEIKPEIEPIETPPPSPADPLQPGEINKEDKKASLASELAVKQEDEPTPEPASTPPSSAQLAALAEPYSPVKHRPASAQPTLPHSNDMVEDAREVKQEQEDESIEPESVEEEQPPHKRVRTSEAAGAGSIGSGSSNPFGSFLHANFASSTNKSGAADPVVRPDALVPSSRFSASSALVPSASPWPSFHLDPHMTPPAGPFAAAPFAAAPFPAATPSFNPAAQPFFPGFGPLTRSPVALSTDQHLVPSPFGPPAPSGAHGPTHNSSLSPGAVSVSDVKYQTVVELLEKAQHENGVHRRKLDKYATLHASDVQNFASLKAKHANEIRRLQDERDKEKKAHSDAEKRFEAATRARAQLERDHRQLRDEVQRRKAKSAESEQRRTADELEMRLLVERRQLEAQFAQREPDLKAAADEREEQLRDKFKKQMLAWVDEKAGLEVAITEQAERHKDVLAAVESRIRAVSEKLSQTEAAEQQLRVERTAKETAAATTLAAVQAEVDSKTAEIKARDDSLASLQAEHDALKVEYAAIATRLVETEQHGRPDTAVSQQVRDLRRKLDDQHTSLQCTAAELKEKAKECETLKADRATLQRQNDLVTAQLGFSERKVKDTENKLKESEAAVKQLQNGHSPLAALVDSTNKANESLKREGALLKESLGAMSAVVAEAVEIIVKFEADDRDLSEALGHTLANFDEFAETSEGVIAALREVALDREALAEDANSKLDKLKEHARGKMDEVRAERDKARAALAEEVKARSGVEGLFNVKNAAMNDKLKKAEAAGDELRQRACSNATSLPGLEGVQNNQLEQLVLNLEGQRESERKKLEEANRSTRTAAEQQVANATAENDSLRKTLEKLQAENSELKTMRRGTSALASKPFVSKTAGLFSKTMTTA
ncbi:hypothetical protein Rhopal_007324-T1 [Rhodotorula paludigena]|uniref:Uncharacterized protein n=1 Tax=Rhodotorula paludigena TaxID=86838 RepID=A0AAV5GNU5_9BASI|nr:hypothetical protein Rhopal_007324-T1 [Rhodotorula paludigena]